MFKLLDLYHFYCKYCVIDIENRLYLISTVAFRHKINIIVFSPIKLKQQKIRGRKRLIYKSLEFIAMAIQILNSR